MPLGGQKRKSSSRGGRSNSEQRAKHKYLRVASIWTSKVQEGGLNISTDDYYGDLIFRKKADEKTGEPEQFFKVKFMSVFEPKSFEGRQPPDGLLYNICLAITNDNALELLSEEETE